MTEVATPTTEAAPPVKNWSLIANEAFGDSYKGEVSQPAPEPEPKPQEPPQSEGETSDPLPEPEASAETESKDEEVPISSIDQLAEKFELDPEWLSTLAVPVKINGQQGTATLADLTKSYQTFQAAEQRLEEVKQLSKAEKQALAEQREQLKGHYSVVAQLVDHAEKMLVRDFADIDWKKLQVQDPAEYVAKKLALRERQEELAGLKQQAVGSYQNSQAQTKQEADAELQQYLQQEQQRLLDKLPEWKDPEKSKTEKQAIATYLMDAGFTKDDISAATDHRMILLARKAMLYDKGQNKADLVKKKVTLIPKVLKPGAPQSPEQANRNRVNTAKTQLYKSGSVEDALAFLKAQKGK